MCLSTLQEVRGCPISIFQLRFPSDDIFFWSLCDYLCCAEATLPTICWDRGNARKLQLTAARALGSVSHVPSCVEIVTFWNLQWKGNDSLINTKATLWWWCWQWALQSYLWQWAWALSEQQTLALSPEWVLSILRPKQRFPVFGLSGGNTT